MQKLSKDEMKKVMGGVAAQNCCSHTSGWGQSQCGYSSSSEAEASASDAAQQCGCHVYYCCDCTNSPGYPGNQ